MVRNFPDKERAMTIKNTSKFLVIATTCLALVGCDGNKEGTGTLMGAGLGGLAGAAFGSGSGKVGMIMAGALLGGFIGNRIGHQMDEQDKKLANASAQRALETVPTGTVVAWRNPDNGHAGTYTPVRTYESQEGYCREYQQTVTVGGKTEKAYGKACRQPDGAWKIVS